MSTLAQLRSRAAVRYRDLSGITVASSTWSDYLNEGYESIIAASPHWPFLEAKSATLTVGPDGNAVALPADAWRVQAVFNVTDKLGMDEMQGRRTPYDAFPEQADSTGVPSQYRVFNNQLQVYPWPAVATSVTVEYAVAPPILTDTASPVFPAQYHAALLHYALEQAYIADDNFRAAEHHRGRWSVILEQMRNDLLGARGDSYPQIVDVGW